MTTNGLREVSLAVLASLAVAAYSSAEAAEYQGKVTNVFPIGGKVNVIVGQGYFGGAPSV
jgi:hypothetical protein